MIIHSTNIHGLGASEVVKSFLEAALKSEDYKYSFVYLPSSGILSNYKILNGNFKRYKRILPYSISRVIECFFSKIIFPNKPMIVLGDIPMRGIKNQVVLVHSPNLIYPKINSYSSKSLSFRVNRFIFSLNHKYTKKIIVQTEAMAKGLISSYPKIKDKVLICPQPVPNWLEKRICFIEKQKKKIFFYPAAFYAHKKHDFLLKVDNYCNLNKVCLNHIEVWLTLEENEFKQFEGINWIKNLGRLNSNEMNAHYRKADALLFLSSMESYGLPLVEAVTLNLPILTVDFPYSRWICENEGYYYEPYSEKSFIKSLMKLLEDLKLKIKPNYSKQLLKFPDSWDDVVNVFAKSLK